MVSYHRAFLPTIIRVFLEVRMLYYSPFLLFISSHVPPLPRLSLPPPSSASRLSHRLAAALTWPYPRLSPPNESFMAAAPHTQIIIFVASYFVSS